MTKLTHTRTRKKGIGQEDRIYSENHLEIKKNIKPLSVNDCWRGQRFKTNEYKVYEQQLLYTLPKQNIPKPPYYIYFEFGLSNVLSDWDNPVKPLQDILQKKYEFNDKDIIIAEVRKQKVERGKEYFVVRLSNTLNPR